MKKASERLRRTFRPSASKKHGGINEEAVLDTSASASSTPRLSQLASSKSQNKAWTFSSPQAHRRIERAVTDGAPAVEARFGGSASGADTQKKDPKMERLPSDSSFGSWAPGEREAVDGQQGVSQLPETAEEEVPSLYNFSFGRRKDSVGQVPQGIVAAAEGAMPGKDNSSASDSRQNAARETEAMAPPAERVMRAQRPLLVKTNSELHPGSIRIPADPDSPAPDAGNPAPDAESKYRRMRSIAVSQVANSPLNPGSPSIYRTWPPKEPAPGYSPAKRPGSAQGSRLSLDNSQAAGSRLHSSGRVINFRSSSLESQRAGDGTGSSPADSSENDHHEGANGTVPEISSVPIFAASDPNLTPLTAGDYHPPEFVSLRRRPPPKPYPSFNVSEGGSHATAGNGHSPRSLSPLSSEPNSVTPWATGYGPPANSSAQLGQPGQTSGARKGSSDGRGGAAASIIPWVSGKDACIQPF